MYNSLPLNNPETSWIGPHLHARAKSRKNKFRPVDDGNRLFFYTLRLIQVCVETKTPFVLENPLASMLWMTQPWQELYSMHGFQHTDLDFCQYNEVWKKPTRLVSYLIDIGSLGNRCTGRYHYCSHTNKNKHVPLQGRDHHGTFMTLRAQPYPLRLVQDFAGLCARTLRGYEVGKRDFFYRL